MQAVAPPTIHKVYLCALVEDSWARLRASITCVNGKSRVRRGGQSSGAMPNASVFLDRVCPQGLHCCPVFIRCHITHLLSCCFRSWLTSGYVHVLSCCFRSCLTSGYVEASSGTERAACSPAHPSPSQTTQVMTTTRNTAYQKRLVGFRYEGCDP